VARWTRLTRAYLKGRPQLRRVLLLIDSRHGIKEPDREMMRQLDGAAVSYQIVLTQSDKLKKPELERVLGATAEEVRKLTAAHPEIAVTSSEKGEGIEALRAGLARLAVPEVAV